MAVYSFIEAVVVMHIFTRSLIQSGLNTILDHPFTFFDNLNWTIGTTPIGCLLKLNERRIFSLELRRHFLRLKREKDRHLCMKKRIFQRTKIRCCQSFIFFVQFEVSIKQAIYRLSSKKRIIKLFTATDGYYSDGYYSFIFSYSTTLFFPKENAPLSKILPS